MKLEIIETKQDGDAVCLALKGVVNIHTAVDFRRQLKPLLEDAKQYVHVDLSEVNFIDSAGLATLVEGLQWSRAAEGRRFVLSGLCDSVRDIFELAKLDTVFEIEDGKAT